MERSKLLGFVVLICFTIPTISCSSDRLFSGWPKSSSDENVKIRVNMTRRSERELGFSERLGLAVDRSKKRMKKIEALIRGQLDAETPVEVGDGEFVMSVALGTPSVSFEAIVDTGSDLIWTQCKPCKDCFSQPTPIFDPSKSPTFSTIPCGDSLCDALGSTQTGCNPDCTFMYQYGDGSFTSGDLAYETLSIGSSKVKGIAFGCGHDNEGQGFSQGGGLVGLGRGGLSLISQLGSKAENMFSYCLLPITDSSSQTSPLFFGEGASLSGGAKTLPLIKSRIIPTFWYIPITGITLNGKALDIPPGTFDLQSDGSGGMIIDSGTTVTILDQAAYSPLKEAIQSAIDLTPVDGSSTGLDLCYHTSSAHLTLPTLVFNFKGGVDYELPADNFFIQASENLLCLAMLGEPSGNPSIFGNIQQQNFHILYNNAQNTLSFKPTKCDSL
ncbi:aspartic proteinase nepenthesin-1-like [Cryptomeria japonica]|uniref:aspartic proteinase nepenthesin-1-like n=1 Tax=Cryptomeria japonica TaxID=3369 RepID=UPI0027DA34C6|nr:aspartic proteinase nepenthesin-1-like [Cryptomeria japonica]XP_059071558.1 aspartic proteinase nepenthesin-1-like [Cryptomeria japonica]